MRLILIRHAESEHSRRGVIADVVGCTGLTERGGAQARALAERLSQTGELAGCRALLSSPVLRARQTAQIVLSQLPAAGAAGGLELDDGLCELRPGEADGMSWDTYPARYGTFDLVAQPDRPFAPGGESWTDFTGRARRTLERLAARFDGETVVAVSHAGFIVASLLVLFDIPRPGTGARLEPAHASLTEWRASRGTWQLERYNDRGLAAPAP